MSASETVDVHSAFSQLLIRFVGVDDVVVVGEEEEEEDEVGDGEVVEEKVDCGLAGVVEEDDDDEEVEDGFCCEFVFGEKDA